MLFPVLSVIAGLILLVWSADRFVAGAAATARHLGMSPLLIGMLVVGFGTSAPEMVVSTIAALQGAPGLALGNAVGSNISNIGLILGVTALVSPITVHSSILRKELPVLTGLSLLVYGLLWNATLSRMDALLMLAVFAGLVTWSIIQGMRQRGDALQADVESSMESSTMPPSRAMMWLVVGFLVLTGSSRVLVWGAVSIAESLGVDELTIGLTIVAIGTSLPELASSIMAALKREHDLALGNIVGSNLFNIVAVVGLAGVIQPTTVSTALLQRDFPIMLALTCSLFALGYGLRRPGRINRVEGGLLVTAYVGYIIYLIMTVSRVTSP